MKTADGSPETTSGQPPESDTSPDRPRRRGSLLSFLLAAWLVLLGAFAVVIAGSFGDHPTVRLVGHDAPVDLSAANSSTDITANNSPTLERNPVNPENLAVSNRIDTPVFSCALHFSTDGGATWAQTAIPRPKGPPTKCFAPDLAFSADGTLYLSFVTLRGYGNVPNAVWLSTSKDGGRTLSKPVRLLGPLAFQVRLAADPNRPKRLYMTWLQASGVGTLSFSTLNNPIEAMRSDDGGATWTRPMRVSSPARKRVVTPAPVVGPKGELYVLYLDLGEDSLDYEGGHSGHGGPPYPGHFALVLARSTDGGSTWAESVVDDAIVPTRRFVVFIPPYPSVAVDNRGRVYAAFQDGSLGDPDVLLWSLKPGGVNWQGPTRVNDTPKHDGTSQYLPKIAVAPDGRLDVLYYDRRADRQDLLNQVSLQSSFDYGKTFTPALRLSSRAFDSRIGFGAKESLPDLGSRLALVSGNRSALAVWTDTRAGTPATQKQELARAVVAVSNPQRLSGAAKSALRYGGLALALAGLALVGLQLRARRLGPAEV